MLHTQQLIDNQFVNDMTSRHNDAVLVDKYTRTIPKQTEYEKACSQFASVPHEITPGVSGTTASGGECEIRDNTVTNCTTQIEASDAAAPDEWHSEAPPVAGVYIATHASAVEESANWPYKDRPLRSHFSHWDGVNWTITCGSAEATLSYRAARDLTRADLVWLRLVEADAKPDARPVAVWRHASQIPQSEQDDDGFWFYKGPERDRQNGAHKPSFLYGGVYCKAPEYVTEYQMYDPRMYANDGAAE